MFICFSLLLLIITVGAVSAADNATGENITNETNTFDYVQDTIEKAEVNSTVILNGTYYGSGEEIVIVKDITIEGCDNATLNANHESRIFNIKSGNVVLKNINFLNGHSDTNGGAVTSEGHLTLINCTFINNVVDDGQLYNSLAWDELYEDLGKGGAVNAKGDLSISDSTFINNSAHFKTFYRDMDYYATSDDGNYGDINCLGKLYLENSYFKDNFKTSILAYGAMISNCIFDGTAFSFYGNGNVSFADSRFSHFSGIWCQDDVKLYIDSCNFTNGDSSIECEDLLVNNSNFMNNKITDNGVSLIYSSNAKFVNSTFKNNIVRNTAVLNLKKYGLENCTFISNSDATILSGNKLLNDRLSQTYLEIKFKSKPAKVYYKSGKSVKFEIVDSIVIYKNGKYFSEVYCFEDSTYETLSVSNWKAGTYKIVLKPEKKYVKQATFKITVLKAPTIVKAPKITAKLKKSKYFKVTVKNKATKKVVNNIKIKIKVYTGKKYKTYTVKTNKKGVAKLNTKKLKKGTHKVVISSGNSNYKISAKSKIIIKK